MNELRVAGGEKGKGLLLVFGRDGAVITEGFPTISDQSTYMRRN